MKRHNAHLRFQPRGGVELSLRSRLNGQDGGEKIKVAFCVHPVEFHSFDFTPSRDPLKGYTRNWHKFAQGRGGWRTW